MKKSSLSIFIHPSAKNLALRARGESLKWSVNSVCAVGLTPSSLFNKCYRCVSNVVLWWYGLGMDEIDKKAADVDAEIRRRRRLWKVGADREYARIAASECAAVIVVDDDGLAGRDV